MTRSTRNNILLVIAIFVGVTLISVFTGSTGIKVDFDEDVLTVSGPKQFSYSVSYDSIAALELVELEEPGEAVSGDENGSYRWGEWENDAWQRYTLCAEKDTDTAICITTDNGSRYLFNYQGNDTTAEIFEMFTNLLAARRSNEMPF